MKVTSQETTSLNFKSVVSACAFQLQGQPHASDKQREEHLRSPAPQQLRPGRLLVWGCWLLCSQQPKSTTCQAIWLLCAQYTHIKSAMRMSGKKNSRTKSQEARTTDCMRACLVLMLSSMATALRRALQLPLRSPPQRGPPPEREREVPAHQIDLASFNESWSPCSSKHHDLMKRGLLNLKAPPTVQYKGA